MKKIMITIGVSFYNDENTIEEMINSVINQSYCDWKMIMMDDGGEDGSLEIVKKYVEKDNRIIVYSDGKNLGLQKRLNMLIDLCDTKYFARMDADDVMVPSRLEKQLVFLEQNGEFDVVGGNAYSILSNGSLLGKRNLSVVPSDIYNVFKNGVFIHPTVMGKSAWFKQNKYCEEKYALRAEDYELWCRTFDDSKFYIIEEPLIFYRENESINKSISNTIDGLISVLRIIKKLASKKVGYKTIYLYVYFMWHLIINWLLLKFGYSEAIVKRRFKKLDEKQYSQVICLYSNAVTVNRRDEAWDQ